MGLGKRGEQRLGMLDREDLLIQVEKPIFEGGLGWDGPIWREVNAELGEEGFAETGFPIEPADEREAKVFGEAIAGLGAANVDASGFLQVVVDKVGEGAGNVVGLPIGLVPFAAFEEGAWV